MKAGDLVLVRDPDFPSGHPEPSRFFGAHALVLGEPVPTKFGKYVKCLCDGVRMFPVRWLVEVNHEPR